MYCTIQPLSTETLFFICLFVMLAVTVYSLKKTDSFLYKFPMIEPKYVIALIHKIGLSCLGCSVLWFKILWMTYYLILDDVLFNIIILNYEF